jgi:hypothetical protein
MQNFRNILLKNYTPSLRGTIGPQSTQIKFFLESPIPRRKSIPIARIAQTRRDPAILQITQRKPVWLLDATFVISEGSSLVLGYSTCLALNLDLMEIGS